LRHVESVGSSLRAGGMNNARVVMLPASSHCIRECARRGSAILQARVYQTLPRGLCMSTK
jgi:hypothetical protein